MTVIGGDVETNIQVVAAEAFAVLNSGRQIAPFSTRFPSFDLNTAYQVAAAVRQKREARGEIPLGRKTTGQSTILLVSVRPFRLRIWLSHASNRRSSSVSR